MGEKKNTVKSGRQALYRKYRSKSLNEIKGQDHITKTLKNALDKGKLSHAYLFTGPRGTGKTSIARILAHEINGLPYTDNGLHLDIIEIDAASNRRIDDVRDLRDKVHIAPVSAKYKVYIIDEVHMLTTESFNALLKTLEEPPAHVIFILATTEVHKLPATIISRTQRHSFRLFPKETMVEHLAYIAEQEGIEIDQKALELLALHGGGSPRDSISLLDQLSSHDGPIDSEVVELLLGIAPQDSLEKLLKATWAGESQQILSEVESLLTSGLTPNGIATQLIQLLRENAKSGDTSQRAVMLMAELLKVQNAQYQQLKLETILLSIAPPNNAPQPDRKTEVALKESTLMPSREHRESPVVSRPGPEENKKELSQSQTKPPKTTGKNSAEQVDFQKHWPLILEATKKKNNPLYTVLRLATPELDQEGLLLSFNFPFHQKKIDEVKHKSMIADVIEEVVGVTISIRTAVDKTKASTSESKIEPQPDPAHASLISNVQDIMGGGEVVNV